MKYSQIHSSFMGKDVKSFDNFDVKDFQSLPALGINIDKTVDGYSMDNLNATYTQGSANVPIEFLRNWLPGFVKNLTTARKIDEIIGVTTLGAWEDEEIVQPTMERTGLPVPYGDDSEIPFASYNFGFERRTIVRFEEGTRTGKLSEARIASINGSDAQFKRGAAALALDIVRNDIGFNGYNAGANRTYGLLNDPNLPAYVNLPNGDAGSSTWATKTFLEITADLRTTYQALRTSSGANVDPATTPITLSIASDSVDYLSTVSNFGNSVRQWIKENYPMTRIVSTPDFNSANGGDNIFYMIADRENISDSTDGGETILQLVPNKFMTVGTEQTAKGRVEDFSNALAGVLVKRPYLIIRRSGC